MKIIKRKNGDYKVILTRTELSSIKNSLASFRSGSAVDYMNNARLDFMFKLVMH